MAGKAKEDGDTIIHRRVKPAEGSESEPQYPSEAPPWAEFATANVFLNTLERLELAQKWRADAKNVALRPGEGVSEAPMPYLVEGDTLPPQTLVWEAPEAERETGIALPGADTTQTDEPPARSGGGSPRRDRVQEDTILSGRYKIVRSLGRGAFGEIYLVSNLTDYLREEMLVLKLISYPGEDIEALFPDLRRKYKAWKVLSDKDATYIVRLSGVEIIELAGENRIGMLMEYMPGGNLEQLVGEWGGAPRTQEELEQLLLLLRQACQAVNLLHVNKLVHRDVKPGNFLLDDNRKLCKVCDFELLERLLDKAETERKVAGTPAYMAPECFEGQATVASDVFALGAMFYVLLCGKPPYPLESIPNLLGHFHSGYQPAALSQLNPLVGPELDRMVQKCLETDPARRPSNVGVLLSELERLGYSGGQEEETNRAPESLARLLMKHLSPQDRAFLISNLERSGFRSVRKLSEHQQEDIIEEYCYTALPNEILGHNCTNHQLDSMARELRLPQDDNHTRDDLIEAILAALGFLPGPKQVPGIETTLRFLENSLLELSNATTTDECLGKIHSGLAAVERVVDLLLRFYGQMVHGADLEPFLSRQYLAGKPAERLTFGLKTQALRGLCEQRPTMPLLERVDQVFRWPLLKKRVINRLDELVAHRNRMMHHRIELDGFHAAQRFGRQVMTLAVEVVKLLMAERHTPRMVQVISLQHDVYGRHCYLGQNERGLTERIFTPLPLKLGQMYLLFSSTNPACVNPFVYPFQTPTA